MSVADEINLGTCVRDCEAGDEWGGSGVDSDFKPTFERSGNTQLLYGSSAKACWIVSIAPSTSASVMRDTLIGILSAVGCLSLLDEG